MPAALPLSREPGSHGNGMAVLRVAFEALSWGRVVDDLSQAWALVDAADRANLGLAVDSFHMLARETPLEALDEVTPEKLFFVQLSDFMWSAPATPEERRETARHIRHGRFAPH